MFTIQKYNEGQRKAWNIWLKTAKNGHFMFDRAYMEYHADRFTDASLMIYEENALVALFPASAKEKTINSHGGLTFGGLILNTQNKTSEVLVIFENILHYYQSEGYNSLIYKAIPHIYHSYPSEEDTYALFRNNAQLVSTNVSSTIAINHKLSYNKGRKWSVKKSQSNGLQMTKSVDFELFFDLEKQLLKEKYNAAPVHTAMEMATLADAFPNNIELWLCFQNEELLAGIIIYKNTQVTHCQYIASNETGRSLGAVDFLIDQLLQQCDSQYFDLGTSNLQDGHYLEQSLIQNKESYGARAICYHKYKIDF